ncbi:phosphatidate cytidylyltransferase [Altererythrobacter sp. H2]|uniref:phosphatidate cytidylyltransferase n=1 Tax=Altererythrobacter sp. H2 TaxID=3108391 RepID=UPI002B4C0C7F|nr:phosphatidate cytidylyltransferase [Altererythrobacter sp. H2]WRK97118.1 phosphatidate cytidylyltransferase [Altererythrobacter sp. H2]
MTLPIGSGAMVVGDGRARNADLGVRTASAVVMLAVAGAALWLGDPWLDGFILLVALACLVELARLVTIASRPGVARLVGLLAGAIYVGLAAYALVQMPVGVLLGVILIVVATDTGAYFSGRTFGGPKIAPRISPSKTWAGLYGGMLAAGLVAAGTFIWNAGEAAWSPMLAIAFAIGAMLAVVAQMGDFFESWLKRRAGVKDSSRVIPGHGGVFDRVDGLLPVAIVALPLWLMHP